MLLLQQILKTNFLKQTVKITYKNRCEWIDQNFKNDKAMRETLFVKKNRNTPQKKMLKSINFSEILLFRNREKLNENFTELSFIYIKQTSESHGKLLKQ